MEAPSFESELGSYQDVPQEYWHHVHIQIGVEQPRQTGRHKDMFCPYITRNYIGDHEDQQDPGAYSINLD